MILQCPLKGKLKWRADGGIISQLFGENYQWYHDNAGTNGHNGLDIATFEGDGVLAAHDGEVAQAVWSDKGGNMITIITETKIEGVYWATIYAHNKDLVVKTGDKVKAGQLIAHEGHTGEWCFGIHSHFGVYQYDDVVPGEYSIGYPNGKAYKRLNNNNGMGGALDPLLFMPNETMEYIIIGTEQYLLYKPLKIALSIGDITELEKIKKNGLTGIPAPQSASVLSGYLVYPGVDKSRIQDIFNL
jgi:murein DD-endopeptidase MepM/ murein hydrolase activator NlpD